MVKHGKLKFEYNQITKYIYIGTKICCIDMFKKELKKKGVKADISLDDQNVDQPYGVETFLWLPTKNHRAPKRKQLEVGTKFMKNLEDNKMAMYVHCERGHGRAPSLVIAYLAKYKKMTLKQATEYVKKKRPVVHPNKNQLASIKKFLNSK